MRSIRTILSDRKRSQRGSVLSAVLIITAFIAILSGALMTELSTNFLLSDKLVNRVATEATVNSAAEIAVSQLQTGQIYDGCPTLPVTSLNGMNAVAMYATCAPVIDVRSKQSFTQVNTSSAFNVDGTHALLAAAGLDAYLAADAKGNLFGTDTGHSSPRWSVALGGEPTGPPTAILDTSGSPDVSYLLPLASSNQNASPSCGQNGCVALLSAPLASSPGLVCFMAAGGQVRSAASGGANFPTEAYFGDSAGNLYAYDATEAARCQQGGQTQIPNNYSVVAGPYVFKGPAGHTIFDEIYVVVSNGSSGALMHFTYSQSSKTQSLQFVSSLPLGGIPVGAAVDGSTSRIVISFTSGLIALMQISSSFGMSIVATTRLPAGSADAPFWCHCPGGANLIGVGATNGALYVVDTNLKLYGSYQGTAGISTTPGADAGGDWFIAADDGTLTEVQKDSSPTGMVKVAGYGSSGIISSSPQVARCSSGICVYFGSADGSTYVVILDARKAVINTCISANLTTCAQGINPRLSTRVEVGVAGSEQTVHVQGWSYYSP